MTLICTRCFIDNYLKTKDNHRALNASKCNEGGIVLGWSMCSKHLTMEIVEVALRAQPRPVPQPEPATKSDEEE